MTKRTNEEETKVEPMPGALLAELFSGGIVVLPQEFSAPRKVDAKAENPADAVSKPPGAWSWLGDFGKKVLVVVHDPSALHINEKDYELLTKILLAVGLSTADIALVNAARHQLTYPALQEKLPAAVALYFGIEPVSIGAPLKFPQFQVQSWNHTQFLYAPSLSTLNETTAEAVALKKELWAALKKIFS